MVRNLPGVASTEYRSLQPLFFPVEHGAVERATGPAEDLPKARHILSLERTIGEGETDNDGDGAEDQSSSQSGGENRPVIRVCHGEDRR